VFPRPLLGGAARRGEDSKPGREILGRACFQSSSSRGVEVFPNLVELERRPTPAL